MIKYISSVDRVIISCKCKGLYAIKRCRYFKEGKKYLVYCYDLAKHDYGFLVSLVLWTEFTLKDNLAKKRGTKRLRTNTIGKVVEI
jgi:hypothetical protein